MEQIQSSFQTFQLSEQDQLAGSVLSPLQLQVLQNELATIAEQILALTYDPLNPIEFAQHDAHLKGQLAALRFLRDRSEESFKILQMRAQQSSRS